MDHVQTFTTVTLPNFAQANVAPLLASIRTSDSIFFMPIRLAEESIASSRHRVLGAIEGVQQRLAYAYNTPIDAVIMTLGACMIITALLHRFAAVSHWCLFSRLPLWVLFLAIVVTAGWSIFLGVWGFHAILVTALVIGGGHFLSLGFIAVHSLLAMGVVQLIIVAAPTQQLVVTSLPSVSAVESSGMNASSSSQHQLASLPTLLFTTNHANGHWGVPSSSDFPPIAVANESPSAAAAAASPSAATNGKIAVPYRQLVSYFDGAVISSSPIASAASSAALDAAWVFGSSNTLRNVVIGVDKDSVGRCVGGNVRYCAGLSTDTTGSNKGPIIPSSSSSSSSSSALEPILVVPHSVTLDNVIVECGAFEAHHEAEEEEAARRGVIDGAHDDNSLRTPCVLIGTSTSVPVEQALQQSALPNGLTIHVNGVPIDVAALGSQHSSLVRFAHFEGDGWSTTADPLYHCLVTRHEPLWHVLVRKWPLTAFLLKRGAEMAVVVGAESWEHVGLPMCKGAALIVTEIVAFNGAVICGAMEGARFPPLPFCSISASSASASPIPSASSDSASSEPLLLVVLPLYSSDTVAEAILSPTANYTTIRLALLQQVYALSEATVAMLMWSGVPLVADMIADAAQFELEWATFIFEWTMMPFLGVGVCVGEAFVRFAVGLFDASSSAATDGTAANFAGFVGSCVQSVCLGLWSVVADYAYPLLLSVFMAVLRVVTYCVNLYADTGFNVQIFIALLQTSIVGYNLHLQGVEASAGSRWSWMSYPYTMSRIAARNYQSIGIYLGAHLVGGLLVMGTTFLPFSGALGLHFLTLNVAFPAGSCYALLHFMGKEKSRVAMGMACAARVVLSVIIQKGVGDLVGRVISELLRMLVMAVVVALAGLYFSWKGNPFASPAGSPTAAAAAAAAAAAPPIAAPAPHPAPVAAAVAPPAEDAAVAPNPAA